MSNFQKALLDTGLEMRPVFVLDPWFVQNAKVGPNRWRFLQQTLADLDAQLRDRGSRLFVARGRPDKVFQKLFKEWNVKKISFEDDTEPYARIRDARILELAETAQVEVITKVSHTLFCLESILAKNGGQTPLTYQKFLSVMNSLGQPEQAEPAPEKFPKYCQVQDSKALKDPDFRVPDLDELVRDQSELGECLYPGGETEGLKRLEKLISKSNAKWVREFEKPKTSPNSLEPSTTVLSPYLKFGCVSPRRFYWKLKEVLGSSKHSQPPVSLLGQLYWREFYYTCAYNNENFAQMEGNPICKQVKLILKYL